MIRHLNELVEARKGSPSQIAAIATQVSESFPNSPISTYAETIAAKNLRLVMREECRTHLGRIGAPVSY